MPPPPAAKTDAPGAAPAAAKPEKTPPPVEPIQLAGTPAASSSGLKAWIPAVLSLILAPALTWATVEYVLVPRLEKKLALPPAAALAAEVAADGGATDGKPKQPSTYEFTNVVVNLAGTMGTRYLKTSFYVVGDSKGTVDLKKIFDDNRTKLYDTTLNVLSSLTLADLEEAGSRNVIREKLVSSYNQVLGRQVAQQVYFSDFVVQ